MAKHHKFNSDPIWFSEYTQPIMYLKDDKTGAGHWIDLIRTTVNSFFSPPLVDNQPTSNQLRRKP
jgi:hypothetical protein